MTEGQFLYDFDSYKRFFGEDLPTDCGYVSQKMSYAMSYKMWKQRSDTISIGVTAALKTTRELKGGTRAHISIIKDVKLIYGDRVELVGCDRWMQDLELAKKLFEILVNELDNC